MHGLGAALDAIPEWISGEDIPEWTKIHDWKNIILVAHNIKFDGAILKWKYGITPARYVDTQSLARAVLGGLLNGHSLKKLAEYLGLESKGTIIGDGLISLTTEQENELASYCLTDVRICSAIYKKLSKDFPENQWGPMDWTIRAFLNPILCLDTDSLITAVENERRKRDEAIRSTGFSKGTLASNVRFSEVVRGLGVEVPTKTSSRTGKDIPAFSRTDEGLRDLERQFPALIAGRLAAKSSLLETRCEKLIKIGKTGPFPFDVQFSGATQTHRYSGGGGAGGNPQNFPRTGPIRESICAPTNCSLVVGDFAQIEARIVAWLANEPKLMSAFREERDVYSEFASTVYGRSITKHTHPKERQFGKTCILGLGYGMGANKFRLKVKQETGEEISEDEAKRVVKLYRSTYFNIPRLWDRAESLLPLMVAGRKNKVPFALFLGIEKDAIVLPSGLKIRYPNLRPIGTKFKKTQYGYDVFIKRYDAETEGIYGGKIIENICQALAGEICKSAIQRAETKEFQVVGAVHDEILGICQRDKVSQFTLHLQKHMQAAVSWMPTLKLRAEVGYGQTWAEAKS